MRRVHVVRSVANDPQKSFYAFFDHALIVTYIPLGSKCGSTFLTLSRVLRTVKTMLYGPNGVSPFSFLPIAERLVA